MKRRKALSILNSDNPRYWYWSYMRLADGGLLGSIWPRNYGLYRRACDALHRNPYYDKAWFLRHKEKESQ